MWKKLGIYFKIRLRNDTNKLDITVSYFSPLNERVRSTGRMRLLGFIYDHRWSCTERGALSGLSSGSRRLWGHNQDWHLQARSYWPGSRTRLSQFGVWGYAKAKKKVIHNQGLTGSILKARTPSKSITILHFSVREHKALFYLWDERQHEDK